MSRGELTLPQVENILFSDLDGNINTKDLTTEQQHKLLQYRFVFTYWLEKPELTEHKVAEHLRAHFPELSSWNARYLVNSMKSIIGNVRVANKEWQRFTVVEMAKKIWTVAEESKDLKAMAMATNIIGKYTKLDKNEADEIPFDKIIPANFEPSPDISVIDPKLKIENVTEKAQRMREKYKKSFEVEDAIEVKQEE